MKSKHLLSFALSFYAVLVLFLPAASIAQTSVDASLRGCVQDIQCAATMRGLGLTGTTMTSPGSSVIVPFARPGAAAAARIVSPVLQPLPGAGAVATGIAAYLWDWGPDRAEDFAAAPAEYPLSFDGSPYGGVSFEFLTGVPENPTGVRKVVGPVRSYAVESSYSNLFQTTLYRPTFFDCQGNASASQNMQSGTLKTLSFGGCPQLQPDGSPEPQFLPSPERIPDALPAPRPLYYPQFDPDPSVTGDERYLPVTVPGTQEEPSIFVYPPGHPLGLADPFSDWRENPVVLNPQLNPDGSPATQPDPNAPPAPAPGASPDLNGQYTPEGQLTPATFDKPHFISHAIAVFSSKFPLDVLGTLPQSAPGASVCPVFEFWGESYELCLFNGFMAAVKVPTLVSFFIWALLAL